MGWIWMLLHEVSLGALRVPHALPPSPSSRSAPEWTQPGTMATDGWLNSLAPWSETDR